MTLDQAMDSVFGRVNKVISAIEAGEDPQPAVHEMADTQPWDVLKVGQEFVRDYIQQERDADDVAFQPPPPTGQ